MIYYLIAFLAGCLTTTIVLSAAATASHHTELEEAYKIGYISGHAAAERAALTGSDPMSAPSPFSSLPCRIRPISPIPDPTADDNASYHPTCGRP